MHNQLSNWPEKNKSLKTQTPGTVQVRSMQKLRTKSSYTSLLLGIDRLEFQGKPRPNFKP
jgi:hypothetical protein